MHSLEGNPEQERKDIKNVTHVILRLSCLPSLLPPPIFPTHHKGLLILEDFQLVPHIKMDARGTSCVPDLQGPGGQSPCKKAAASSNGRGSPKAQQLKDIADMKGAGHVGEGRRGKRKQNGKVPCCLRFRLLNAKKYIAPGRLTDCSIIRPWPAIHSV